jgi:hypothetical protein
MRIQSKPIVALTFGAVLLFGGLCVTSQAQGVVGSNEITMTATIPDSGNTADELVVQSVVTGPVGGNYTYTYDVFNPGTDPAVVNSLTVDFNTAYPGAFGNFVNTPSGDIAQNTTGNNLGWAFFVTPIAPGSSSGPLSYTSTLLPTSGNADATGNDDPPSPWAADTAGSQVLVPNVPTIPEPATTTLFAVSLLALVFRFSLLKLNKV